MRSGGVMVRYLVFHVGELGSNLWSGQILVALVMEGTIQIGLLTLPSSVLGNKFQSNESNLGFKANIKCHKVFGLLNRPMYITKSIQVLYALYVSE